MSITLQARSLQGASLPAYVDRLINHVVSEGVLDLSGGSFEVVEQASPNMTVRVGSGTAGDIAVVQGEAALQGRYLVVNEDAYAGNAAADVTISEGDPSDPRIDLVVLQVYDDPFDSSGSNESTLLVVEGTPAASPSAPAVPDNALALASILVAAGESTSITDGDITDLRVQARLGRTLRDDGPRGVLGYAQRTSNVGTFTTETDITDLSVTVDVAAGRKVKITAKADFFSSVAADRIEMRIKEGATQLQRDVHQNHNDSETAYTSIVVEPSAGSHTYKVTGLRADGTGNITMSANSGAAAVLIVEDVGPA